MFRTDEIRMSCATWRKGFGFESCGFFHIFLVSLGSEIGLVVRGQEVGFLLGLAQSSHPQQMVNPYIGHAHCMNLRHLTFWSDRFLNPTVSYVKTLVIKTHKYCEKC